MDKTSTSSGTASSRDSSNALSLQRCQICHRPGGMRNDKGYLSCVGCKSFVQYYSAFPLTCYQGKKCVMDYNKKMCDYCRMRKCEQFGVVPTTKPPKPPPKPKITIKRSVILAPPKPVVPKVQPPVKPTPPRVFIPRNANSIYCQVCWVTIPRKVYRYGVLACRACAEFYKNHKDMMFMSPCTKNQQCRKVKDTNWTLSCENCRLWKCVNAGMSVIHEPESNMVQTTNWIFHSREVTNDERTSGNNNGTEGGHFVCYPDAEVTRNGDLNSAPQQRRYFEEYDDGNCQFEEEEYSVEGFGNRQAHQQTVANFLLTDSPEKLEFEEKPERSDLQGSEQDNVDFEDNHWDGTQQESLAAPKEESIDMGYRRPRVASTLHDDFALPKQEPEDNEAQESGNSDDLASDHSFDPPAAKRHKEESLDDEEGGYMMVENDGRERDYSNIGAPVRTNTQHPMFIPKVQNPERLPPAMLTITPPVVQILNSSDAFEAIFLKNTSRKRIAFKAGSMSQRIQINSDVGVLRRGEQMQLDIGYDFDVDVVGNDNIYVEFMNAPDGLPSEDWFQQEGMRYRKVIKVEFE